MNRKKAEKVIVAGGTGFLGKALTEELVGRGYDVTIFTRNPSSRIGPGRAIKWDGETLEPHWIAELEGAKAIINLTGKGVNCRQTKANRKAILQSRIKPTETIGRALRKVYRVPEVWLQAGSLAIYGNAGDRICDESAFVPDEYPCDVCVAWEEALGQAIRPEMRWAMLRIGFVLGTDGGALPTLARLAKMGLGGRLGSGDQWISWIHRDDMVRLFIEAIENPKVHGIYNATGLQPVTNAEFMSELRACLRIPFGIPTPAPLLKIGAPILGADPDLGLNGRRGLPLKIHGLGFQFNFQDLGQALRDLLCQPVPLSRKQPDPLFETQTA